MTPAEEAQAALMSVQRVTDLHTARGSHEGCGECCSRFLPVTPAEVAVLRSYVADHVIRLRPEAGRIDLTCPLLTADRMCAAYPVRPAICRVYDCAEHARGVVRVPPGAPSMRVRDLREELEHG